MCAYHVHIKVTSLVVVGAMHVVNNVLKLREKVLLKETHEVAEIRISSDGEVLVKYFTSTRRKQLHVSSQRSHFTFSTFTLSFSKRSYPKSFTKLPNTLKCNNISI